MARLLVSSEFLLQALFGDITPEPILRICGVSFDGRTVELDIEGPDVPDAEHVIAELHVQRKTVTFKPV